MGCIGTHPALLPRNRGRHPLIWTLIEDLKESGLTFLYLNEGTDDGDILWQKSFQISDNDNASTLYLRIEKLAEEAIRDFIPQLKSGNAPRVRQDHKMASYWRKRSEKDGEIIWSSSTRTIYNLVRALTHPYVGAHTWYNGVRIQIWDCKPVEHKLSSMHKYGTVLEKIDDGIVVATSDGAIQLKNVSVPESITINKGDIFG